MPIKTPNRRDEHDSCVIPPFTLPEVPAQVRMYPYDNGFGGFV